MFDHYFSSATSGITIQSSEFFTFQMRCVTVFDISPTQKIQGPYMLTRLLISSLFIASFNMAMPTPKAHAGVAIGLAGSFVKFAKPTSPVGGPLLIGGTITAFVGAGIAIASLPVGIVIMALQEDGNVLQEELEAGLTEKYSFIQDPTIVKDLAALIKYKAQTQNTNYVSVNEEELAALIEGSDLLEIHPHEVKKLAQDLK